MVELSEAKGNSSNNTKLQLEVHSYCLEQAGVSYTFACYLSVGHFFIPLADSKNLGRAAHLY